MLRPKFLLISFVLVLCSYSLSNGNPYKACFSLEWGDNPREINIPGLGPSIHVGFTFGPFMNACDWPYDCWPPPEECAVIVEWKSPNVPDCYDTVFIAGVFYGQIMPILGKAQCGIIPANAPECCQFDYSNKIRQGYNKFWFNFGPVVSGEYRISLLVVDYPLWKPEISNCEPDKPGWMRDDWKWVVAAQCKSLVVRNTINDYIGFSRLFYISEDGSDTLYDKSVLNVLDNYYIICKVRSNKRESDIPGFLSGWLRGENMPTVTQMIFDRWVHGDDRYPCDQYNPDFPPRDYTFKSIDSFRPIDLFNIPPEEWSNIKKDVTCILRGQENFGGLLLQDDFNDISILAYSISDLCLQPLNTTTRSFIPANNEKIKFQFFL